jgi:hypothetical protein
VHRDLTLPPRRLCRRADCTGLARPPPRHARRTRCGVGRDTRSIRSHRCGRPAAALSAAVNGADRARGRRCAGPMRAPAKDRSRCSRYQQVRSGVVAAVEGPRTTPISRRDPPLVRRRFPRWLEVGAAHRGQGRHGNQEDVTASGLTPPLDGVPIEDHLACRLWGMWFTEDARDGPTAPGVRLSTALDRPSSATVAARLPALSYRTCSRTWSLQTIDVPSAEQLPHPRHDSVAALSGCS